MKVALTGFRIVGILAMAFAVMHCGDSDVRVSTGPGIVPSPGTFSGTLSDGGGIVIEVGSIESVSFDCDDETITETFTPPRDIESDGSFSVGFSDGGREFRVEGVFRDNNTVDGTINDEDNECDVSFDAFRGGPGQTPTVVLTPTPGGNVPTATGGVPATSTAAPTGPTATGATATPTPAISVSGPTATPTTVVTNACPIAAEVLGNAGTTPALDSGWTGLAHDATVIQDGKLTFTVDCPSDVRPCGDCTVTGPVANAKAGAGDIASQRCTGDTAIKCNSTTPCPGGTGTCEFYFGAPLPLSAGQIGTCVSNQVSGSVSGTANRETGNFDSTINLTSRVYTGISATEPCPVCGTGSGTPNDGVSDGTCSSGQHAGAACDINGRSPVPSFGNTSLDCPPTTGSLLATLTIGLSGSSGTETRTLEAASPDCTGGPFPGGGTRECFCPPGGANSAATKPNACIDLECTPAGNGGGECAAGPVDQVCGPLETFRGCLNDTDCPAPGDACGAVLRPCFLDNGLVGGSVTAVGAPDTPDAQGRANPTFAALFCIPAVGTSSSVNNAGGLPGLGRLVLPLATQEIYP